MRCAPARLPSDFEAELKWDGHALACNCFQASLVLLIATVLYQRPLLAIRMGESSLLVRPWDLAWLVFLAASVAALVTVRPPVDLRGWGVRRALSSPLALLLVYGTLGLASLSWHYVAFRGDGLPEAAVGALRVLAIGYLAVVLVLLWTERLARILRTSFVGTAVVAALLAIHSYVFATSVNGFGVTRVGGPFGNFFADGTVDRWWAYSASSTELGYWVGAAMIVLCLWTLGPALRRASFGLRTTSASIAVLALAVALALTHSRESWVALGAAALIVAWALRHRVPPRAAAGAAAVTLAVGVAIVFLVPSVSGRLSESFQPGTFAYRTGPEARWIAWKDSVRIGNQRFPIGWGASGVSAHPDRFGRSTAENMFLQAYMETGILGLALLLGIVVGGARAGLRRLRAAPSDAAAGLAAGLLTVLTIHGLFGNSSGDPSVQVLLGVAVASATAVAAGRRPPVNELP